MLRKEIKDDNELYLYFNDKLIYKRWLNHGYSKVFDRIAYGKDTFISITQDENGSIKRVRKIFIRGECCDSKLDFWNKYVEDMEFSAKKNFGKNLDAFHDAITTQGPGYPGDCIIEITGIKKLEKIFGKEDFDFIIGLLRDAEFVDLIIEKENYD